MIAGVLFRLLLLTGGLGLVEIGLTSLHEGGIGAGLLVLIGFVLLAAGTIGFLAPMFEAEANERTGS